MRKLFSAALIALAPVVAWAGDDDDFGTWLELGVEKSLPKNLEVGLSTELRTENNVQKVDRWAMGVDLGYRLNKYLKFGVGYNFLLGYTSDKTSKEEYDVDGNLYAYRFTPGYWTPRHRFNIEATASIKAWKWVRFSVRERYQYTHKAEKTVTGRYDTEAPDWEHEAIADKVRPGETDQVLRSRFKVEMDKKHINWSPFISLEFHNNVAAHRCMNLDKLRTAIGTGYKIDRHNDVSLSYVLTCDRSESVYHRMHAVCLGYSYDF